MSGALQCLSSRNSAVMRPKSEGVNGYFIDVNQRLSLPAEYKAGSQIIKLKITAPKITLINRVQQGSDANVDEYSHEKSIFETMPTLDFKECYLEKDTFTPNLNFKLIETPILNFSMPNLEENCTNEVSDIVKHLVLGRYRDTIENFVRKAGRRRRFSYEDSSEDDTNQEYSEEEFLIEALGSDIYCSVSSIHTNLSTLPDSVNNDKDNSVCTSHISELVSVNRQSVVSFTSASETDSNGSNVSVLQNVTQSQQEICICSSESEENFEKKFLKEEIARTSSVILQVSKALDLCHSVEDFSESMEKMEAEAVLLSSTIQRDVLTHELKKIDAKANNPKYGHVRLSNIKIPLLWTPAETSKYTRFFVCIFQCGRSVLSSGLLRPNDKSELVINKCLEFNELPDDFKINVQVFSMYTKIKDRDQVSTKDCTRTLHTLKRRFSQRRYNVNSDDKRCTRTSSFMLYSRATITRNSLKQNEIKIENIYPSLPLVESLQCEIQSWLTINIQKSGFLTLGENSRGVFTWNRQWCVLDATELKFWSDPGHETDVLPNRTIDLTRSLLQSISPADKSCCSRPKTLYLAIGPKSEDAYLETVFLSTDSQEELNAWTTALNSVLTPLVKWDCLRKY